MLEKRGLPFKQTKTLEQLIEDVEKNDSTPDAFYSKNYYSLMTSTIDEAAAIQTRIKFEKEIDMSNSPWFNEVFPTRTLKLRQAICNIGFIADTIKIKLNEMFSVPQNRVIWRDIRVTKNYLRQAIRKQPANSQPTSIDLINRFNQLL